MRTDKIKQIFSEEFTDKQKAEFLMLVGLATLRGLGWDKDYFSFLPKMKHTEAFDKKHQVQVQVILGHILNTIKKGENV